MGLYCRERSSENETPASGSMGQERVVLTPVQLETSLPIWEWQPARSVALLLMPLDCFSW